MLLRPPVHSDCRENFKVLFDDLARQGARCSCILSQMRRKRRPEAIQHRIAGTDRYSRRHRSQCIPLQWRNLMPGYGSSSAKNKYLRKSPPAFLTSFYGLKFHYDYHAGPTPVVLPSSAREVMRQDFLCESCGCRYSTIGAGYFCPACCHNSAAKDFDQGDHRHVFSKSLTVWMKLVIASSRKVQHFSSRSQLTSSTTNP